MILAVWTYPLALAQDPPQSDAPPAATITPVPIEDDPTDDVFTKQPPAAARPSSPPVGLAVSAEAAVAYDEQRLRVYPAKLRGWRYGLGPLAGEPTLDFAAGVNVAAVDLAPRLAVAEGDRMLSVPTLMETLGDNPALLRERIERKRWTANAWTAVSALGLVGAAVAFRLPAEERRPWLISSAGALVGGLVFGGNAQRRANRLERDVDLEYDRHELVERVKAHNKAVARELGIAPSAAAAQ